MAVPLSATHIENRMRVQPSDANNYGTAHGGIVTKWMDEVGAMSAMRFAGETCVTARIDQLDFERPIPEGDTVFIRSYVYKAGRTSVHVRIEAYAEEPRTGEREKTTESRFVFVALDDESRPTGVPDLAVETDEERELREKAIAKFD